MSSLIFNTDRLVVKVIEEKDAVNFSRLLSDAAIVSAIPQPPFSQKEIKEKFANALSVNLEGKVAILGVYLTESTALIGLCAFLTNNEKEKELGYRFLEEYWNKGFATELTQGAINFCFNQLKLEKLTADVAVENKASVKVLSKFFKPVKEFYNKKDGCYDRRYELNRSDWNV